MDLFSLNRHDEMTLYIKNKELDFWLQFFSSQTHWRGLEITSNDFDEINKNQLINEFRVFDALHQRLLMFLPEKNETIKELISLDIHQEVLEIIYSELEDFKEFCLAHDEVEYGEICEDYLQVIQDVYVLVNRDEFYH